MGRFNGRSIPFPGFSRGVPIRVPLIGEKPEAPTPGRYFYHLPAFIQRPGQPAEAAQFETYFPRPIDGILFRHVARKIAEGLASDGQPAPNVILLTPFFLGFVPEAAAEATEAELQHVTTDAKKEG